MYEKPSYEMLIGIGEMPTIWIYFGQGVLVCHQVCLDLWTEPQKECVQPMHFLKKLQLYLSVAQAKRAMN